MQRRETFNMELPFVIVKYNLSLRYMNATQSVYLLNEAEKL